jgi:hypothetical protein
LSTPDALAKSAREKLALALNALQTSPDPPVELLDLAEPIAQTMGILHRIERSRGQDLSGREHVVGNIRKALDVLQNFEVSHPAVDAVMEQVAGCLSAAHQLSRMSAPSTPGTAPGLAPSPHADPAPSAPAAPASPAAPAMPPQNPMGAGQTLRIEPNPALKAAIDQQQRAAQQVQAGYPTQPLPQAAFAAPQHFPQAAPVQQQQVPQHAVQQQAVQAQHAAAAPPQTPGQSGAPKAAPSNRGQAGNVVVGLGAHSVSNFYKGLGGNDVIEYGGIFVSTYQIPKLGTPVSLYVKLPGDLEFQATGVVQWIREASGDGVEPGFGARFTQITPEGRQLVYRYTRNREPILYDDL